MDINKFGKVSIALICALFIGVIAMPAATLNAAGGVKLDSKNFPDKNFRNALKTYDTNGNGTLSDTEIKRITYLNLNSAKVSNLKGLEKLPYLTSFYCASNGLKSIDVSKNTKLEYLSCTNNKITSITGLSNLKSLRYLYCTDNSISSLDVSKNTEIQTLYCSKNKLTTIKGLSNLKNLRYLYCSDNSISSLDVSKHGNLLYLDCSNNKITSLKFPNSDNFAYLYCSGNKLKKLDVSDYNHLTYLKCDKNELTKLVISNPSLKVLYCANNKLTTLDVSEAPTLTSLTCHNNKIKKLDVSSNKLLSGLSCYGNGMTSLELSKSGEMMTLYCNNNKLETLDLKHASKLAILLCNNNQLTELDLKDHPKLMLVSCVNNNFDYAHIGLVADGKEGMIVCSDFSMDILESASATAAENVSAGAEAESAEEEAEALFSPKAVKKIVREATTGSGSVGPAPTPKPTKWKISNTALVSFKTGYDSGITYASLSGKQAGAATLKCTVDGKTTNIKVHVLYKDVTDRDEFWFEPTRTMTEKGVVKGYDKQTKFKPGNDCTRAQMVTFLWRLAGSPAPTSASCNFTDVKKSDYYYKAVLWAVEKGITTGTSKTKFSPKGVCTRAQTVTFLWRMAGQPSVGSAKNPFKDVKQSDYFYNAVIWASKQKIVAGYKDSTFKPKGKCLRRQMVTFLYKYNKNVIQK